MFRSALLVLLILSAATVATAASCPAEVPGNTPEAIRANGERIVCLQNELASATRLRHFEMQLEALQKAQQDALIQQRINSLPAVPVYEP
jgi:hypothetical protein